MSLIAIRNELAELRKMETSAAAEANVAIAQNPSLVIRIILIALSKIDTILNSKNLFKDITIIYNALQLIKELISLHKNKKGTAFPVQSESIRILRNGNSENVKAKIIYTDTETIILID